MSNATTTGETLTVLLVDDQPHILTTLTRFLTVKGYAVEIATTVAEAIPLLQQRRINAVILDVRMAPQSGLDLLPIIREDEKLREIPAVVLTGSVLTKEEQTIVARHKAFVFYKPKSYQALTEYLDRVTRRTPSGG
ncbi:MAG: response regulator [Acidobacteria bacterium]|nr:response regulator [Acidobacteriota bacterium]